MNETVEDYINMVLRAMADEARMERCQLYIEYIDRMELENMMQHYQAYDEDYI